MRCFLNKPPLARVLLTSFSSHRNERCRACASDAHCSTFFILPPIHLIANSPAASRFLMLAHSRSVLQHAFLSRCICARPLWHIWCVWCSLTAPALHVPADCLPHPRSSCPPGRSTSPGPFLPGQGVVIPAAQRSRACHQSADPAPVLPARGGVMPGLS